MLDQYKDAVDNASYSELYQLARGILIDLEAMKGLAEESAHARTLFVEIGSNFELYLCQKV